MTALGIALMVIGTTLVAVEAHVPSLGALGAPGVLAVAVGAVLAVSGLGGGLGLALATAVLLAFSGAGVLWVMVRKGIATRQRAIRTGPEGMVGRIGVVRSWGEPHGRVLIDGALWRARRSWSENDEPDLHEGDAIVVERLSGLTLAVRRAEEWELAP